MSSNSYPVDPGTDGISKASDPKQRKVEQDGVGFKSVFKDFELVKVLREDDRLKFISLHGRLPVKQSENEDKMDEGQDGNTQIKFQDAVILLEKKPFNADTVEENLKLTRTEETLQNDVYSTYDLFPVSCTADMKATLIYPATEKHIEKYMLHEPFIIHETPELYDTVTLPCLNSSRFSIQWVHNILEKKTEADRIIAEDGDLQTGFVLVPDMKWDRKKIENLYAVAIVRKHGLKSIRDLRSEHLPLLKNILKKGSDAMKKHFGVTPDKLRIYFHYQPSYYHLHVHFTHILFDAPGTDVMRAHLINDVIDNITLDGDFYKKKTLSYLVKEGTDLYNCFKDKNYFETVMTT